MFMKIISNYMKLSQFKQLLLTCLGLFVIASCGGGNNASKATGWDINSKKGGFQFNVEFEDQETHRCKIIITSRSDYLKTENPIDLFAPRDKSKLEIRWIAPLSDKK